MPTISVVIPVYNSEKSLPILISKLAEELPLFCENYEIILVNDGSEDTSWKVISKLSEEYNFVIGINLMRNYGQHNALLCGIRNAQSEYIVTMDDDLQHPPEEIRKLYKEIEKGFDVVYAEPAKMPHSAWRNFSSWLIKRTLAFVMGIKTVKNISSFRIFKSRLRKSFSQYKNPGIIIDVLLSWGTTKFSHIEVNEIPREFGKSNYDFWKLLNQVFLILTGYSTIPLRLATFIGFFFTAFGFAIFIYVVIIYFGYGSLPGFPFLASIISIFSGTQLFSLGIIGEYVGRVFNRSIDRPPYVIDLKTNSQQFSTSKDNQ
ncbi:MAG: glycosyltransferase family 2 protein [Bacteroidales bacterium]|nr:glycosyltransferase family 2 protein [Bacteroidales bacterium]